MITLTYFDFLCNLTLLLIILFTALSYATGLFYIAELAEEFPTTTKRIIRYIIIAIAALHTLAFASALPKLPLVIGLLAHLSYLPLLTTFPVLPLSSPTFYISLLLLLSSQVGWYYKMPTSPYSSYPSYGYSSVRTYSSAQLLAFYLLFVWLVPLVFFVAGSVSGQSLPVVGERVRGEEDERKDRGGRWSIAGIGRWCRREKGSAGQEKQGEELNAAESSSNRYEPNPAYYGHTASSSTPASTVPYMSYQQSHQRQLSQNGNGATSWYGQHPGSVGVSSTEGEWMGQRNSAPPHMAVRQRSHIG